MVSMDPQFIRAQQAFQYARQRARMQEIAAQLTGKSVDLLVFEEVRQRLNAIEGASRERRSIPLEAIIGSVGRYKDFNRSFLPLRNEDRERWARVRLVVENPRGLPPIEVYQVGEAYFVVDGNHRVSIARELGATEIEAFVRRVHARVPLSIDTSQEDLIILSEYAQFLEQTHLDDLHPGANLRLTAAGQYDFLLQQIEVQHFLLELNLGKDVSFPRAASQWYETIYLPIIELIRARQLIQDFPTRTEADFFVWLLDHQAQLAKETGWQVRLDAALNDLISQLGRQAETLPARLRFAVLNALPILRSNDASGQWRADHQARPGRLFGEILVPLTGPFPTPAFAGALEVAQYESAQVYSLYLAPATPETQTTLRQQFNAACQSVEVEGRLVFDEGKLDAILPERSRWVDLVVAPLERVNPARAGGGSPAFRPLIQNCQTPLLLLPGPFTMPTRALLAYDGSERAREALFLAAYLSSFWGLDLVVLSVIPEEVDHPLPESLAAAEEYLQHYQISASFCHAHGDPASEILRAAQEHACDLILLGGYGVIPRFGGFRRRTVDNVLAKTEIPVLISR